MAIYASRAGQSVRIPAEGVIFDFYGTLAIIDNDAPDMYETLSALGYPCTREVEQLYNSEGYNGLRTPKGARYATWRREQIIALCCYVGVPKARRNGVVELLLDIDRSWTVHANEWVKTCLSGLRDADIPFAIVSNWDYDLEPYLMQAGIDPYTLSITSARVGYRKPHPAIYKRAVKSLGVSRERIVSVGDSWSCDVLGSVRAGLIPCWLTSDPRIAGTTVYTLPSLRFLVTAQ